MNKKWVIILFLVILSVPIGWSLLTQTGDNNLTYPTTNENDGAGSQNPFAWTDWPDGLPAFIPKLEGEISFIFGPDNDRISIRYDPYVSEENVEEYIELCKETVSSFPTESSMMTDFRARPKVLMKGRTRVNGTKFL